MKKNKIISRLLSRSSLIVFSIVFLIVAIDLFSKHYFDLKNLPFIEGFISFEWVHNTGAAWSIFGDATLVLAIISGIFIFAWTCFYLLQNRSSKLFNFSFVLILAGAVGNFVDRVSLGYVRDFVKLDFFPTFPTFNVADSCLVIGVILLAIYFLFFYTEVSSSGEKGEADETRC